MAVYTLRKYLYEVCSTIRLSRDSMLLMLPLSTTSLVTTVEKKVEVFCELSTP